MKVEDDMLELAKSLYSQANDVQDTCPTVAEAWRTHADEIVAQFGSDLEEFYSEAEDVNRDPEKEALDNILTSMRQVVDQGGVRKPKKFYSKFMTPFQNSAA